MTFNQFHSTQKPLYPQNSSWHDAIGQHSIHADLSLTHLPSHITIFKSEELKPPSHIQPPTKIPSPPKQLNLKKEKWLQSRDWALLSYLWLLLPLQVLLHFFSE